MTQTPGFPRLQAAPGNMVALRYQGKLVIESTRCYTNANKLTENGHVTLPQNGLRKPEKGGKVYLYGTTHPKDDEKFLDVFQKWNEAGTGGDKRGRLLAVQNYDDVSITKLPYFPHTSAAYIS